jgi:hypothetical protein
MKLGLKTLIVGILAVALLVPTATAKPGNGKGNGPPAWAGGGSGGAKENGKPPWAGQGQEKAEKQAEKAAMKAEKAARKEARRAAAAGEPDTDAPKHDNPAWVCKFEREQMGAEAFADSYGTNANKRNAFGNCVSSEAHDRDGVTEDGEETPEPIGDGSLPPDGEATSADALAALQAFLQALRQLVMF